MQRFIDAYCYNMGGFLGLLEMVFRTQGSVVPKAARVAAPAALLAVILKIAENHSNLMNEFDHYFMIKQFAFTSFSGLLGFLIVFRSSQAYTRYWNGGCLVQQMLGSWFDVASSLIAFTRTSKVPSEQTLAFHHKVIKLFSLLTALCLVRLEAGAQSNSPEGSDQQETSQRLKNLPLTTNVDLNNATQQDLHDAKLKIELVFHWIQGAIVDGIDDGTIGVAPPIASRAFQELGNGLVKFEDCMKICILPIPFPYSQTTVVLLGIHWLISPLTMCGSTSSVVLAALYTFTTVFTFWSLFFISMELENPFGEDENDLDVLAIQESMNIRLMGLVQPAARRVPEIVFLNEEDDDAQRSITRTRTLGDLCDVSDMLNIDDEVGVRPEQPLGDSGSYWPTPQQAASGRESRAASHSEVPNVGAPLQSMGPADRGTQDHTSSWAAPEICSVQLIPESSAGPPVGTRQPSPEASEPLLDGVFSRTEDCRRGWSPAQSQSFHFSGTDASRAGQNPWSLMPAPVAKSFDVSRHGVAGVRGGFPGDENPAKASILT